MASLVMRRLLFTLTISFSFLSLYSQDILSTIDKYANDFGQEKIYLHFDKSTYAPSETVWYKIYLMKGIFPANESKSVYIDWTDEKGKLLLHSIIPIEFASAAGQFDIPEKYTGSYIHAKVYTKWMLNFDSAFLYNKDIRVISTQPGVGLQGAIPIPTLQFFPEGGELVSGVTCKVAFKANDQWGRPVNIGGIVQNNKGKIIDSLRFVHDGMGYIALRPEPGESFSARWYSKDPASKTQTKKEFVTELPPVQDSGVSLQLVAKGDKRIFRLEPSPASARSLGSVHVIGTLNQFRVFNFTKTITTEPINLSIPTKDLPSGVLVITVFDNKWTPLAERITFINNEEFQAPVEMNVQHWGLNKRARNEIEITAPDSLFSNLSVAVTDLSIDADSSDNIISHLLLSSELKGIIYNPAYYFTNNSDTLQQQLDLVMLTHGWRRFRWNDVAAGKLPNIRYPKDTTFLSLSGKLYGIIPSQMREIGSIPLVLQDKEKKANMLLFQVEPDGTFKDPSLILFDTISVYYQLSKNKAASGAEVKFMEGRLPPFSYNLPATGFYNTQLADTTGNAYHIKIAGDEQQEKEFYNAKVLETVTVKAKTKSPTETLDEKYTSGLFSGGDAIQFDFVNDPFASSSLNILNYLQGRVAGLQISTGSPPSASWRGSTPLFYLDESPVDISLINTINTADIAYVKVLRPPFFGGMGGGAGGAIAIYTRKGDEIKSTPGGGLDNSKVWGYNLMREFYSPVYSSFAPPDDKKDLRTTLYWNPNVRTISGKNKVILKFYNNDITKAFRVVIEGMTEEGRLVHYVTTME